MHPQGGRQAEPERSERLARSPAGAEHAADGRHTPRLHGARGHATAGRQAHLPWPVVRRPAVNSDRCTPCVAGERLARKPACGLDDGVVDRRGPVHAQLAHKRDERRRWPPSLVFRPALTPAGHRSGPSVAPERTPANSVRRARGRIPLAPGHEDGRRIESRRRLTVRATSPPSSLPTRDRTTQPADAYLPVIPVRVVFPDLPHHHDPPACLSVSLSSSCSLLLLPPHASPDHLQLCHRPASGPSRFLPGLPCLFLLQVEEGGSSAKRWTPLPRKSRRVARSEPEAGRRPVRLIGRTPRDERKETNGKRRTAKAYALRGLANEASHPPGASQAARKAAVSPVASVPLGSGHARRNGRRRGQAEIMQPAGARGARLSPCGSRRRPLAGSGPSAPLVRSRRVAAPSVSK